LAITIFSGRPERQLLLIILKLSGLCVSVVNSEYG